MQSRLLRGLAARIVSGFHYVRFAPGELSSRREFSLVLLTVLAPLPEVERQLHSGGSQWDLAEGMETGGSLSLSSPARSTACSLGSETRSAVSSPQRAGSALHLSPSLPPQSPQYEELLEVVTRAVGKLNIDWPADNQIEKQRSKLDERFLRSKSLPLRQSLPFFPDLHIEVSRSWKKPFSSRLFIPASHYYGNVAELSECGYRAMPRVEQTLAGYLSPGAASSLKAPVLPTKPLRVSSALEGKGYTAAGQAGACLHMMSVLQAYQADLLKELDEGEQISASDIGELRRTADLALLLPNVSRWVLQTVEKVYRIQFSAPPPPFKGLFLTCVSPEQALVLEQEVSSLLRKEAIEVVPPLDRESGFYSRYFAVPKKDGALRPILDLRLLNRSVRFRMLTVKQVVSQIRCEDWFVTIDLKDAYFHIFIFPSHRKFLRFAFRGKAYQYRVLPFGLTLSPRTFTKCVDAALAPLQLQGSRILNYIDDWLILAHSEQMAVRHRDVVLAQIKELGLRLNANKSLLSPLQRTTYLGVVLDSTTIQARLSPARIKLILTTVRRVRESLSLTVKQFQRLLGLMAAVSNVIPFGLLYMRPLQWWLKSKGFSPRANPFRMIKVTRRCLRALDMWRKPWFLSQGPVLGAPCRRIMLTTDASLTGWGAVMSGHPARGLWSGHHLTWHINCLEMLAVFRALKHFLPDLRNHNVLVRTDNTAVVSYINHQGDLRSCPLYKLAHQILVWSQDKFLSLRAVYIPGHLNVGADILSRQGPRPGEWRLHPEVVKRIWRVFGQAQVDLFATRQTSHCPLWYSLTHPAPLGLDAMVQTWPRLRLYAFPPIVLLPGVLERVRRDGVRLLLVAPLWPDRVWLSSLISLLDGSPWEIPVRRDLLIQAEGMMLYPCPELWKLWAWPLRGRNS